MLLRETFSATDLFHTWWMTVIYIVGSLCLIVAAGILLRARVRSWRRWTISVLAHVTCAELIIGFGFLLEPVSWLIFNYGTVQLRETFQSVISDIDSRVLIFSFFPATTGAIAAMTGTSLTDRIFRSALAIVAGLTVTDTVRFGLTSTEQSVSTSWAFSVFSDIVGGTAAGIILGSVSSKISAVVRDLDPGEAGRPHPAARLAAALAACGVLFLTTVYFVFIYHIPAATTLQLEDWADISFEHFGPEFSIVNERWGGILPVYTKSFQVGSFAAGATIRWSVVRPDGSQAPAHARALVADLSSERAVDISTATLDELARRNVVHYTGPIPTGDIEVSGLRLVAEVWAAGAIDHQPPRIGVFVPRFRQVVLQRLPEHVHTALREGRYVSGPPPRATAARDTPRWLGLRAPAESFAIVNDARRIGISLRSVSQPHPASEGAMHDITFSNGPQVFISAKHLRGSVAVLIEATDSSVLAASIALGPLWSCRECEIDFGGRDRFFLTSIKNVRVGGARGRLEVSPNVYELKEESSVALWGGTLLIESRGGDSKRLSGDAHPVLLNGAAISHTVWSSVPNEIKAVIIGTIATAIWGIAMRLRGTWARRPK